MNVRWKLRAKGFMCIVLYSVDDGSRRETERGPQIGVGRGAGIRSVYESGLAERWDV